MRSAVMTLTSIICAAASSVKRDNQRFSRPRRGLRALLGKKPLMVTINERSRWSFRLAGCRPIFTSSVQTVWTLNTVNQGVVGDTTKLIMHRLIARQIRRNPTLVERAKIAHARQADQYAGWPFVDEWNDLLDLPPSELTSKLISRDREMVRLRNSSPFYLAEGVDFGDYRVRIRISRAARRVAERGLTEAPAPRAP
jgi:hypothetical protein